MRQLWIVVALAGCNSILGINELTVVDAPPGTDEIDAALPIDPVVDAPVLPTDECFGTEMFGRVCFTPSMHVPVTLPATLDTSVDCDRILTPTGAPAICVIISQSITVPLGGTSVTGARPLMLAASDSITVGGDLKVGSVRGARIGPGANPAEPACTPPTAGGSDEGSGGGGAGGSFGSLGGDGAAGRGSDFGGAGTNGGLPLAIVGLRGGCPGSVGGRDSDNGINADRGTAGDGGGAVYLVAGTSISLSAELDASGAGGGGAGGNQAGGGGGGSGGMIVLEAPSITIASSGEMFANGGGGGKGTETGVADHGDESTAYNSAGAGGSGSAGGNGGDGAFQATQAELGSVAGGGPGTQAGGGAGGGGVGVIRIKAMTFTGNRFSPTTQAFL